MTQEEFTHIASEMRRNAVSAAQKYGFAPDDAEDIAQDVMIKLWCLHEKISDTARLQASVAITTRHVCIDRWRTAHVHADVAGAMPVVDEDSMYDRLEYAELEQWMDEQIGLLPTTSKIVLTMRQLEHRELSEIADILGIKQTSVSTLLTCKKRTNEQTKKEEQMMRQYDKQKIARILSKFMAGETSLDEEQLLAEYFRTHEVGNEWQEYKEMFALFDSGAVDIEQEAKPTAKPKVFPFRWIMTGIAASILLLIGFSILIKDERPTEQQPVVTETTEQNTQQSKSSEPIIEEKKEAPQKPSEPSQKFHPANKPHKVPQEPLLAQAEPATEAPARNYSEETASNSSNPYLIVTAQLQDLRSRGERLDREVAMMMHN